MNSHDSHFLRAVPTAADLADDLSGALVLRDLIDEAIHFVVTQHYPRTNQGLGKCQVYASLGAHVLRQIFGEPFLAVAGGQITDFGGGAYAVTFASRNERRQARTLEDLPDYHCWIQRVHRGNSRHERLEVVDFTLRHDPITAGLMGHHYLLHQARGYFWGWHDDLRIPPQIMDRLGSGLRHKKYLIWKDEHSTQLLRENEARFAGHYELMAGEVFRRMDGHIDTLAGKVLPSPASHREMMAAFQGAAP